MSRRRLYTLFEAESMGVREWIRERRLERCRRDLRDAALAHETVMTIATRWGFVDASHFSHSFRDAYGTAPSAYRAG
jgi:AraC-like DNA-binding protein